MGKSMSIQVQVSESSERLQSPACSRNFSNSRTLWEMGGKDRTVSEAHGLAYTVGRGL